MVGESSVSVIERLKKEIRTCPECALEVRHPFVERCPRCYSKLPKIALECSGCIHQVLCPLAKETDPATR
jgi:hypothetical protein